MSEFAIKIAIEIMSEFAIKFTINFNLDFIVSQLKIHDVKLG